MIVAIDWDVIMVVESPTEDYKSKSNSLENKHKTLEQFGFPVAVIQQGRSWSKIRHQQQGFQQ